MTARPLYRLTPEQRRAHALPLEGQVVALEYRPHRGDSTGAGQLVGRLVAFAQAEGGSTSDLAVIECAGKRSWAVSAARVGELRHATNAELCDYRQAGGR